MKNERRDVGARADLLARARAEFSDMPGLRLSREQAGKLWSVDRDVSERILQELEKEGVLRQLDRHTYCRRDLGA